MFADDTFDVFHQLINAKKMLNITVVIWSPFFSGHHVKNELGENGQQGNGSYKYGTSDMYHFHEIGDTDSCFHKHGMSK